MRSRSWTNPDVGTTARQLVLRIMMNSHRVMINCTQGKGCRQGRDSLAASPFRDQDHSRRHYRHPHFAASKLLLWQVDKKQSCSYTHIKIKHFASQDNISTLPELSKEFCFQHSRVRLSYPASIYDHLIRFLLIPLSRSVYITASSLRHSPSATLESRPTPIHAVG